MPKKPGYELVKTSGKHAFSPQVEVYLREAGWSPLRRTDPAHYEKAFEREGISLTQATRDFLGRYGGLVIKYQGAMGQTDVLDFCADDAVRGIGARGLHEMERLLDVRPLCPIGYCLCSTCLMLQDERGRVFGVSDDTTSFLGESGEEAVENILSLREPRLIRSEVIEYGKRRKSSPEGRRRDGN
jgi:SUKH-3 immunity protein